VPFFKDGEEDTTVLESEVSQPETRLRLLAWRRIQLVGIEGSKETELAAEGGGDGGGLLSTLGDFSSGDDQ